jgi:hypothetical protein
MHFFVGGLWMRYCDYCQRMVKRRKEFSWGWFVLFCLTGIGGFVYVFYFIFLKRKACPICGGQSFSSHAPQAVR